MSINIILCGFMGSGKNHLLSACKLSRDGGGKGGSFFCQFSFFDLDEEVANCLNISPNHLGSWITSVGIEVFRAKEKEIFLQLVSRSENKVIALGGGSLGGPEVLNECKKHELVFLETPFEMCYQRIKNDPNRPLAQGKTKEELFALYQQRLPDYHQAKYTLKTMEREKIVSNETLVHNLVEAILRN